MRSLVLTVALFSGFAAAAQSFTNKQYREDFQFFRKTVGDNYCYFEKKGIDWEKVASLYTAQVATVTTRDAFVAILENALNELYDHHSSLGTNTDQSRRLVPTGADMWAEYKYRYMRFSEANHRGESAIIKNMIDLAYLLQL